jgi:dihydroxy-acid dehydratase
MLRSPTAIVTMAAIGGSTNAVVHLLAIAGRLGIDLTLDDFDRIGSHVPLLVDLQPAGRFLMDDFYRAGGLLAVLREVRDLLDPTGRHRHWASTRRRPGRRPHLGR